MDKGIRPAAIAAFLAALPGRENTTKGNTVFRKGIIGKLEEDFGITHAAGATHYNHAFIEARKSAATNPELAALLVGLGRPEDKKGGRKPKLTPTPVAAAVNSVIPTPVNAVLANFLAAIPAPTAPDTSTPEPELVAYAATLMSEGIRENTSTHTVTTNPEAPQGDPNDAGETGTEQTLFTVKKKSNDEVVKADVTLEEAKTLVAAASAARKAKLYWI